MNEIGDGSAAGSRGFTAALFWLSASTLGLQVLVVRMFSYAVNHAFVYLAVALAMLGFGMAGVVAAIRPVEDPAKRRRSFARAMVGCGLGSLAALMVFARQSYRVVPTAGVGLTSPAILPLLVLIVPFYAAGLATVRGLSGPGNVSRRYAASLVGGGLGALLVYPLLAIAGPAPAACLLAGVDLVAAMGLLSGRRRAAVGLGGLALLAASLYGDRLIPLAPDEGDQFRELSRRIAARSPDLPPPRLEWGEWDPVGRIEIHRLPGEYGRFGGRVDCRFFSQDAGAGSLLISFGQDESLAEDLALGTVYGLATRLRPGGHSCVIGLGGGPDLVAVLAGGANEVTGVDVNSAVVRMLEDRKWRAELGLPSPDDSHSRLDLVVADGRGFARANRGRFDTVQLTGADTYAASAAGGSVLAEGYLYTVEGIGDLYDSLRPGGFLVVTRFAQESLRVFATAELALEAREPGSASRSLALVAQGPNDQWGSVIVKRGPLLEEDVRTLEATCAASGAHAARCGSPAYDQIGFAFDTPMRLLWQPFGGISLEAARQLASRSRYDLRPVHDDRPYFFQFQRPEDLDGQDLWRRITGRTEDLNRHHFELADVIVLLVQFAVVATLLLAAPLIGAGRAVAVRGRRAATILVFSGLGAGYMFCEIGLMQRTGLLLGHPTHAIATVLAILLLSSGVGSGLASLLPRSGRPLIGLALLMAALFILGFRLMGGAWLDEQGGRDLSSRLLAVFLVTAPLGLVLGLPFPMLYSRLQRQAPALGPWALGANALFGVLASLAAVPLAMTQGFGRVLDLALAAYLVALFGLIGLGGRVASSEPST